MVFNILVLSVGAIAVACLPTGDAQAPVCSSGATMVPHPTICQRFTNCSIPPSVRLSPFLQVQEDECLYPQLFDVHKLACANFKEAECGPNRVASKDPCAYVKNLCGSSHCEPCSSRLPSCVGLSDGNHAHPSRQWSPYYIVCDTERTINITRCPTHAPTGTSGIFSPTTDSCVSVWEVPQEQGGLQPSCQGKVPGLYRVTDKPDVYYSCPGPQVFYCGQNLQFNETTKRCQAP
ncbi:unnamed protein product [Candidula unifasciata]|uniref:Chitin-binding type-2 domain-containing protein n=1 Tax=Candidula unifasciata TaxID=100452 RepID=A0A8S3Z4C3_9EUPU|nr:unnamed protein product [Candidula unifasciata]